MKNLIAILILTFAVNSFAVTTQFVCQNKNNIKEFKLQTTSPDNLLYGFNQGGMFGMGVCWWHTRLQQAALYLATFSPNKPKPTEAETKRLLSLLTSLRGVVEIPGYSNLDEFSAENWAIIQKKLNHWQLMEGIFGFAWVRGLAGKSSLPTQQLRKQFEAIYDDVEKLGRMSYVKLQMAGISAHALLIVDVYPTADGFRVEHIDSNDPQRVSVDYFKDGEQTFTYYYGVPYLERRRDFDKISRAQSSFCEGAHNKWSLASEAELDQVIFDDLQEYYNDNIEQYK